jgi:hypothetical protein
MPIHVFAASDNFTGGSEASGDIRHAFLSTARALDAWAFAAAPLPWPNGRRADLSEGPEPNGKSARCAVRAPI